MTIDSSGNIGIGTTSPWGKLSVTNTGSGPSLVVEDQASPDATPFVVDQNGNVGVGTGSPSTRLEIRDSNAFSGHAIGNSTIGATSNVGIITNSPEGTDVGGMLTLGGMRDFAATNPGVFGGIRGAKENALNGNNDGYLGFYTLKGGEAFAERMRITSSGKVGIGTTSPWRTLSVAGTAAFSGLTSSTGGESAVCLSSSGELRVNTGAQTWGAPQSVGGSVAGGVEAG